MILTRWWKAEGRLSAVVKKSSINFLTLWIQNQNVVNNFFNK